MWGLSINIKLYMKNRIEGGSPGKISKADKADIGREQSLAERVQALKTAIE